MYISINTNRIYWVYSCNHMLIQCYTRSLFVHELCMNYSNEILLGLKMTRWGFLQPPQPSSKLVDPEIYLSPVKWRWSLEFSSLKFLYSHCFLFHLHVDGGGSTGLSLHSQRCIQESMFKVVSRQLEGRTDSFIMQLVILWTSTIYMRASHETASMT